MLQYIPYSPADSHLGDTLFQAFGKVNENFTEIQTMYATVAAMDILFQEVYNRFNDYSLIGHTHSISDITGLQTQLSTFVTTTVYNEDLNNINDTLLELNDSITSVSEHQDNIDIKKRFTYVSGESDTSILAKINNLAHYTITDTQSVWFVGTERIVRTPTFPTFPSFPSVPVNTGGTFSLADEPITETRLPAVVKYKMINKGKGTYGAGYTQLTLSNIELMYSSTSVTGDVEDDPATVTIQVGMLTQSIVNWLNNQSPAIAIQAQNAGYTIFKGIGTAFNNIAYLWVGAAGTYGVSASQSVHADFQLLTGAPPAAAQNLQSVLDTGSTAQLDRTVQIQTFQDIYLGAQDIYLAGNFKFNGFSGLIEGCDFKYSADYSNNYTDRSLVDKGYVDTKVDSLPRPSGLERVGDGYRLVGADPNMYGEIGENSVDISKSDRTSGSLRGAEGNGSFVGGYNSGSSGYTNFIYGNYCYATFSQNFVTGNNNSANSNQGFISGNGNKIISNISLFLLGSNNSILGGFQNTIGSSEFVPSDASIIGGSNNLLLADYSTILGGYTNKINGGCEGSSILSGIINTINSRYSTIIGNGNQTNGSTTTAIGNNIITSTVYETIIGTYPNIITGNATTFVLTDSIFRVGIGTATASRKDGFRVYKNGVVTAPTITNALIIAGDVKTLTTKEYVASITDLKANLASPALTGIPTAPTAVAGNNTTQIATTAYVRTAIAGLTGGSGSTSSVTSWGNITGLLSNQNDLQNALNLKFNIPTGSTSQYVTGNGTLATFTMSVPYNGATQNLNLGEKLLYAGQAYFASDLLPAAGQISTIFGVYSDTTYSTDNRSLFVTKDEDGKMSVTNRGGGGILTNTAFGTRSLISNTTGSGNTSFGYDSLTTNIIGLANVAIGYQTLKNNISDSNVAIGYNTMFANTTGLRNVAIGRAAMQNSISGQHNVSIGYQTLASTTQTDYNTILGTRLMQNSTTGSGNTWIGFSTSLLFTTNVTTGSYNTIIGGDVELNITEISQSNLVIIADGQGNKAFYKNADGNVNITGTSLTFNGSPISSGSSTASSLQAILSVNNTASTPIVIGASGIVTTISSGNVQTTVPDGRTSILTGGEGLKIKTSPSGSFSTIVNYDVTGSDKVFSLPNATGRAVISVNNLTADVFGNITLPITGGSGTASWGAITGTLSNQTDIQNAFNLKLNTGANTTLAGTGIRIPLVSTTGVLSTDSNLSWNAPLREVVIGSTASSGNLNVVSNIFQLAVQNNIASGQSNIVFNSGQEDALSFRDKAGVVYMTFKSIAGNTSVILKQREIYDESIFYPVTKRQASVTTAGGGVEVSGRDSFGATMSIPFTVDTTIALIDASVIVKNATAGQLIAAKIKATAKRVGGVITITSTTEILSNHTSITGFTTGVKQSGNNSIYFYFTPAPTDTTAYTGAFTEIKYSIN